MILPLIILADSNLSIGAGHAMRSIAVAQEWILRGGRVQFLASDMLEHVRCKIDQSGAQLKLFSVQDYCEQVTKILSKLGPIWVWLDGYHFKEDWIHEVYQLSNVRLGIMDDGMDRDFYHADLVVNQNPYAKAEDYLNKSSSGSKFLMGTHYCLLRNEFLNFDHDQNHDHDQNQAQKSQEENESFKVLLTLGGSSINPWVNYLLKWIAEIETQLRLELVVIADNLKEWEGIQLQNGCFSVIPAQDNFSRWVEWSDLAITAAGATLWELMNKRVPCVTCTIADNQWMNAEHLNKLGAIVHLGDARTWDPECVKQKLKLIFNDPEQRTILQEKGNHLVDGMGRQRVVKEMLKIVDLDEN